MDIYFLHFSHSDIFYQSDDYILRWCIHGDRWTVLFLLLVSAVTTFYLLFGCWSLLVGKVGVVHNSQMCGLSPFAVGGLVGCVKAFFVLYSFWSVTHTYYMHTCPITYYCVCVCGTHSLHTGPMAEWYLGRCHARTLCSSQPPLGILSASFQHSDTCCDEK